MRAGPSIVASLAVVLLGASATPLAASGFTARLQGALLRPSDRLRLGPGAESEVPVDIRVDDGGGVLVAAEYRLGRRFGLDAALLRSRLGIGAAIELPAITGSLRSRDRLDVLATTLGIDVHLTPERALDVYLGPRFAYVRYGDVAFDFAEAALRASYSLEDDPTYGALVGVDVPMGRWAVSGAVLYLPTTAEAKGVDARIDLDLLVTTLGFSYRF